MNKISPKRPPAARPPGRRPRLRWLAAVSLAACLAAAYPAAAAADSQWEVNLSLNSGGAAAFSALTSHLSHTYYPTASTNQNNAVLDEIAIVVDGNVVTAPVIQGAVPGGKVQITGNFTRDYAQELAAQLQSGRLPVNFRISAISIFAPSASSQAPAN